MANQLLMCIQDASACKNAAGLIQEFQEGPEIHVPTPS